MKCDKCGKELKFVENGVIKNNMEEQKVTAETSIYKCINSECENYGKMKIVPKGY